jgi:phage baseplate assembly protein V
MEQLLQRIRTLLGRGVVKLINAAGGIQLLQIKMGSETLDNVPYMECYGFTGVAKEGAEALVGSIGGNRSLAVALVVGDRRYRLKGMEKGEVAMYTDEGDFIHFKRNGHIHHKAGIKITFETPLAECSANFKVGGEFTVDGTSTFNDAVTVEADVDISGTSTATDHMSSSVSGANHPHTDSVGGLTSTPIPEGP